MAVPWQACIVIVGCVLVHLTLGTLYTFGNISPYLTSYIRKHGSPSDLDYATSVWINSLAAVFQGTSMYFGGRLEHWLNSPRLTVLMGAWFQSLGVLLTYFTIQHSFALTMVTYGVMFGLGIGVAYAVPMAVAMRWLPDRKGLVNGFVVAGFGGGAFIFDQIQTAYINPDNKTPDLTDKGEKYFTQDDILERVPKVFLLMGGCYAVMQFLGCLPLRNPPWYEPPSRSREVQQDERQPDEPGNTATSNDITDHDVTDNSVTVTDNSVSFPAAQDNIQVAAYRKSFGDESVDILRGGESINGDESFDVAGGGQSLQDEINDVTRREASFQNEIDDVTNRGESIPDKLSDVTHKDLAMTSTEILRQRDFYKLWFIFLSNGQGVNFVGALYKAYGQTFISNDTFLAWVGTFSAVCNSSGRIIWGSIADKYSFKVAMMCLCALFTILMLTLGVTSLAGKWMFIVWVGLLFLSFSGSFSLMPTATARSFGQTHVSSNYGLLFTSQVVTSLLSAVLTSQLQNAIGWYGMFFMVAGFSFFSFLLVSTFNRKAVDGRDV